MPAILNAPRSTAGDERQTPRWLFAACSRSWGPFSVDCAATNGNALCPRFIGPGSPVREDALDGPIPAFIGEGRGKRAFLNPPYSAGKIGPFTAWAAEQARSGWTLCCLLPLDPSTRWWKVAIGDPFRPHPWIGEIVAVGERVFFDFPGRTTKGGKATKANFPSVIVVMRPPFETRKEPCEDA